MRFLDWLVLLAGLVILAGLGWWGTARMPVKAAGLESALQASAEQALAEQGFDWARVRMDGQKAILSGQAPSADKLAGAEHTLIMADGQGGMIFGGVTFVETRADKAPRIAPYVWRATKTDDGRLVLTGHVPSERIRQDILRDAAALAPGAVDDRLQIGTGEPAGNWQGVARLGLAQLGALDSGEAKLLNTELSLRGVSMDPAVRARVSAEVANLTAPYVGKPEIRGPGLWTASHESDGLRLAGKVASEAEKIEIASIARRHYAGQVLDEMVVEAHSYDNWIDGVRLGLPHFTQFRSGAMAFDPEGEGFVFAGEASGSTLAYLREDMARLTGPYGVSFEAETVEVAVEEIAGIDFGADPVEACEAAFDAILQNNTVNFASGSAEITRDSGLTLDKLMAVSGRCAPDLVFELQGHTDASGDRAANVALSEARAAAVAAYMEAAGFDGTRLQPVGFGPDQPVADNDTPEGRAANRRIEFRVRERSE